MWTRSVRINEKSISSNRVFESPPEDPIARSRMKSRAWVSVLSPRALFSPATAKRRDRVASLNWRIENNRVVSRGARWRERRRRTKTRGGIGRVGEREQADTASTRLTEAVSLRFIAALDHERRKTSQGRPVLRSSLPSALRPSAEQPLTLLLFLNEHLLSGKTVWQLARARTWSFTPRLVKHHFYTTEKQFNSLVSLFSRTATLIPLPLPLSLSSFVS